MLTLVIGGAASGKSQVAECIALRQEAKRRYYLATLLSQTSEDDERIARHQMLRAGKGFHTLECPETLPSAELLSGGVTLLEGLGVLLANRMFSPRTDDPDTASRLHDEILALAQHCAALVVVSDDVTGDGDNYDPSTRVYQQALAKLNNELADQASHVVEVVCGIPLFHKGGEIPL